MSIKLNGAALGSGEVRLAWVNVPPPSVDLYIDGVLHEKERTASTVAFLEGVPLGKHVFQIKDGAVSSNKVTITVL